MVTLNEAKLHLRIVRDDEDEMIQTYILAATAAVSDYLNLSQLPDPIPAPVRAAVLLQVGDLYENREAQGQGAISQFFPNPTFERLLNPYREMHA
ncbi:head-tail connector protein [Burkholderia orbicola]|uniref:Uncharacterized phage protein (Possible DNA packaging) n=1 Tax=Burkholderia orbicola (strain MC0-3) TaxID=406425 RepID=B1JZH2_BURO0|nr:MULTISPECIES: head-tail connector protein [Burkholderia cepacia complex]ACA90465.1 uncharacterized phage protein (possible DNA packaging) [Burkholderia orbicola MC0-3]MDN7503474.1 head-tail connector protein [Burkholderia orbicola]